LVDSDLQRLIAREALKASEGGGPVVTVTVITPSAELPVEPGTKMLVYPLGDHVGSINQDLDGRMADYVRELVRRHAVEPAYVSATGEIGPRYSDHALELLVEVHDRPATLLVVGGGHVGRSILRLGTEVGFYTAVIDDREEYANRERFPEVDEVICDDFEPAIDRFPIESNTYVVLVTRGHRQDEASLRRCLTREAAYVGMIGSRRRTQTVLRHMLDEGFPPDRIAKVRTPIGLDIGAETPEEIAVSIIAEIVMFRRGGSGKPMYYREASLRSDTAAD
jgi:xanthine dehydrogenase accessory factor